MSHPVPDDPSPNALLAASTHEPEAPGASVESDEAARAARAKKKKREVRIEHKVPGRIRMKIPSAKNNPEFLTLFQSVFSAIPGITKVKAKPDTGSIVIHYDPSHEAEFQTHFHRCCAQADVTVKAAKPGDEIEEIASKIEAEAEFLAERSEAVRATVDLFKKVDYQIKAMTDNTIDLKFVLVGGLAVATFVEIGAEAATPMWVTLGLFAMNHLIELKQDGRPAADAPATAAPRGAAA
ncbi:HMA2 domain-containing protein [Paraburkholderia acidipaludis]|uniref:HMA2 domain-containing protein n=1 Tax=Paraburkholderia acidipaludis TaxID=660537 RepID=UPI0004860094|nr:hypothetical protein [Paraburkholderia acidipaludis]